MKIEITDEIKRKALDAYNKSGPCTFEAAFIHALKTVAPIIADQALERAAQVADKFAWENRALAAKDRKRGEWTAVDELNACANEAEAIAAAIRALKEPTP